MAADRKTVDGDLYFPTTKIFKINGDLVGAAGNAGDCEKFLAWYDKQRGKPPTLEECTFAAIALTKKGIFSYDSDCVAIKVDRDYAACGSGGLGALVAMENGADPKTAIEKVSAFENNTSFETDVLEI